MNKVERNDTRGFVVRWMALCMVGLTAGLAAGLGLAGPIETLVGMMLVTPVALAVVGSVFGAAQACALRPAPRVAAGWVAASALGLGIGLTAGTVMVEVLGRAITGEQVRLLAVDPLGRLVGLGLLGTIGGLAVGAAQWFAVRRHAPLRVTWVLWCATSFGVAFPTGGLAADALVGGLQSVGGVAIFFVVSGLLVGGLTVRAATRLTVRAV